MKVGNRRRKLSKDPVHNGEIAALMEEAINESYLTRQRNPVKVVYDNLCRKIDRNNEFRMQGDRLSYPHYSTVCRVVERVDGYEKMKARYGKRIADREFMAVGKGPRPTRAMERIEIDHTKLDLFVVDEERGMPIGRPWLTMAIDVYSKVIVGFYLGFDPPGYLSVMQCLLHAIKPKGYVKGRFPGIINGWCAYGIPELIVVDNGREFHSKSFEDACYQLGSEVLYAPIRQAWYKGSVERYFGTLNLQLLHSQPVPTNKSVLVERMDLRLQDGSVTDRC